jgi:20S proteasome alpha/beta subunit
MARRTATRNLSDAFQKARSKGAKPARVSLILGGIKYKPGQAPARVCPAGRVASRTLATKL